MYPHANGTLACPEDYPEYIVERMFYGADLACDCIGIWDEWISTSNTMGVGTICDYN